MPRGRSRAAYGDQAGEVLASELRPGNAGANAATEQITVAERAVGQIPAEHIKTIELLLGLIAPAPATSYWTGAARVRSRSRSAMT